MYYNKNKSIQQKWPLSITSSALFITFFSSSVIAVEPVNTLGSVGETDLQIATGNAVQAVCGSFIANAQTDNLNANQATLFDKCGEMVHTARVVSGETGTSHKDLGISREQLQSALQNVATEEAATVGTMATQSQGGQVANIGNRIAALIRGAGNIKISRLGSSFNGKLAEYQPEGPLTGGAAGEGNNDSRRGYFINGGMGTGDKEQTNSENAFDFDSAQITAGMDFLMSDNAVLGVALGYTSFDSEFVQSINVTGGAVDATGYSLSAFGLYYQNQAYFNWIASVGNNSYDIRRDIVIGAEGGKTDNNGGANDGAIATAKADTDSTQFSVSIGGGYEYSANDVDIAPYGRLEYGRTDVDGYSESGAGALDLLVDEQEIETLTSAVGIQISKALSREYGVLVPQARLEWIHEFEDSSRDIVSRYVNDPRNTEAGHQLIATTDDPDEDYFSLSLGLSSVIPGGKQFFVEYSGLLGLEDMKDHQVKLGFRMPL